MPLRLPRDKFDLDAVDAVAAAPGEALGLLPGLLAWLYDPNWPVARALAPVLPRVGPALGPALADVLRTGDDDDGKASILASLGPLLTPEQFEAVRPELERLATHPTEGERREGAAEEAERLLREYRGGVVDLPTFRYHPDPLATGSVVPSDAVCECCGQARGYAYDLAPYGPVEVLCPWCIASGEAHRRFGSTFTYGDPLPSVPAHVRAEVVHRTPGFAARREERWLTHHGDACAYLGPAGRDEIEAFGSEALQASLRQEGSWLNDADYADFYASLDRDGYQGTFVFRCLHCGTLLVYIDL